MLAFRVHNVVPPGNRYWYEVPETKVVVEALTYNDWVNVIRRHYAENGLVVPADVMAKAEDFMCRRLPEGFCFGDLDGRPRARVLTLNDIRAKTQALVAFNGRERVPPLVSKQRAETCGKCPANDRTLCPTCIGLVSWALRLVGEQSNGIDAWLGVCQHDGVALAAKIRVPRVPFEDQQYPGNCWWKGTP